MLQRINFLNIKRMKLFYCTVSIFLTAVQCYGQNGKITGYLNNKFFCSGKIEIMIDPNLKTTTDSTGYFEFKGIQNGERHFTISCNSSILFQKKIHFNKDLIFEDGSFFPISVMEAVKVSEIKELNGISKLSSVSGGYIFAGKKNDVILMEKINANLALNNTRQVFSKVAGVNIWENDGSGIQVNIASRGLSPNRSWEFNMRQNGYDIAADIFGYPDMYYSPPMEALSSIELVRGAASLQYGTQLGGLLNFKLKRGPELKKLEVESSQTVGSYGLFSSYNSVGGQNKKLSYFGYFYRRSANAWRENADYNWKSGYGLISYRLNKKLSIDAEFTTMNSLLHLAAGLSELQYLANHRQSVRERNWFNIKWNIPALTLKYKISEKTNLTIVNSLLIGWRNSIENIKPVDITADTGYRDMRKDNYLNLSIEARLTTKFRLIAGQESVLAVGFRYYNGRTNREQGRGTNESVPDFAFINPGKLEYNSYTFRTTNFAVFAESIIRLSKRTSLIPGIRYENIKLTADGYYNSAGTLIYEKNLVSKRNFPLFGIGFEHKVNSSLNIYANVTQGYRAANFNDIRITEPNLVIDSNLKDSKGCNMDIGAKFKYRNIISAELTLFYLIYKDRIGVVSRVRPDNSQYLFSTNVASSANKGIEFFAEVNLMKGFNKNAKSDLFLFTAYAYTRSIYVSSDKDYLKSKLVEYSPEHIFRSGLTYKINAFSATFNGTYVSKQFSNASNTVTSSNGNNGIIPAYHVFDLSAGYTFSKFRIEGSANNFTNNKYFTRRATSYPGPGIIPAEPRVYSVSLKIKI